jgi:hypothetical protein
VLDFFNRLFNQYKLVRRTLVLWALCLITYAILRTFSDISAITTPVVTALATVCAILTPVLALYQWSRMRDKEE